MVYNTKECFFRFHFYIKQVHKEKTLEYLVDPKILWIQNADVEKVKNREISQFGKDRYVFVEQFVRNRMEQLESVPFVVDVDSTLNTEDLAALTGLNFEEIQSVDNNYWSGFGAIFFRSSEGRLTTLCTLGWESVNYEINENGTAVSLGRMF